MHEPTESTESTTEIEGERKKHGNIVVFHSPAPSWNKWETCPTQKMELLGRSRLLPTSTWYHHRFLQVLRVTGRSLCVAGRALAPFERQTLHGKHESKKETDGISNCKELFPIYGHLYIQTHCIYVYTYVHSLDLNTNVYLVYNLGYSPSPVPGSLLEIEILVAFWCSILMI